MVPERASISPMVPCGRNFLRPVAWCLVWGGLALVLVLALAPRAGAHADLILQIEELTKSIEKDSNNAELYLRRAHLRREHLEYDLSNADIEKAYLLSTNLVQIDLMRGRLYLEWGWPLSARACLDRYLIREPKSADGLVLRARVLNRLNLQRASIQDYDRALQLMAEPGPDLFVERAQALMAGDREHWAAAVRGLDDGLKRLGPLVTLQLFAIDAELKLGNFDSAIARVDKIAERSPRKETWLSRRGEILVQAGRPAEALKAYQSAQLALQTLPPTRRNVPAMQELARRIQAQIDSLANAATPGVPSGGAAPLKP